MALSLVSDALWERIATLLPPTELKPKGGRPRASDRACLAGILFVLETGCAWNDLPLGSSPSGPTCWRRFREWGRAGVWSRLWEEVARCNGRQPVDESRWTAAHHATLQIAPAARKRKRDRSSGRL